jgi:hypothetical protein
LHDIWEKRAAEKYAVALDAMHITQNILLNPSQRRGLTGLTKFPQDQEPEASV